MNAKVGNLSWQVPQQGETQFEKPYSEATAKMIDEEARALVQSAYDQAMTLLTSKRAEVHLPPMSRLHQKIDMCL